MASSDGFHQPNFADDETRTFNFPASPDCPGLPATAGAYSVNIQFRPTSRLAYLTAFPTGTTMPTVSTLVGNPAWWTTNAAIVPAGTGGQIDIYCQFAGPVVIDINGYYAAQSLVSSLNTLTGDVTLAQGSNVTITPSGNTLTIAASAGSGGVLPTGTAGQTLYDNGSSWIASSALTNDGTNVGSREQPPAAQHQSCLGSGVIEMGGLPFLHNYNPPGSCGANTFIGQSAGNFTMGGGSDCANGSLNTAVGPSSFSSNTLGRFNTAVGVFSLALNSTGSYNTASGGQSLYHNTGGWNNTATGSYSLTENTGGHENTAGGAESLGYNTTGNSNTASGYWSLGGNTTGSNNTAVGYQAGRYLTTGSYNIDIGNQGVAAEGNTIRIGDSNQANTYIAGIYGVTVSSGNTVMIDASGHLGSVASGGPGEGYPRARTARRCTATARAGWRRAS